MIGLQRRVLPLRRLLFVVVVAAVLAIGAGVGIGIVGSAAAHTDTKPIVTVASTPTAAGPTADEAAAARLDRQTHESDYCQCNR